MKQGEKWQSIKLDSFNADIPFSISMVEILNCFHEKGIQTERRWEQGILVKSKMLSLDIIFFVSFQFIGERLAAISLCPDIPLEGKPLICRYNKIQSALENIFGKPHNPFEYIVNLLVPEERSFSLRSNNIRIEHYILNRHGIEELIDIKF